MKAPFNQQIRAVGKLAIVMATIDDCSCADAELRCCAFEPENYDDFMKAAQRFVACAERARIHEEKQKRSKISLPKDPLYFAVHHRGKHVLSVRIKASE